LLGQSMELRSSDVYSPPGGGDKPPSRS
jgi:hypothetical protein